MRANLAGFAVAADAAALAGNAALAADLYEELRSHEGARVAARPTDVEGASVDYYLGLLARTGGRWKAAAAHLDRALALHLEAGEEGWAARVRCEIARVLLALGDAASLRHARSELESVRAWPGAAGSSIGDEAAGLLARAQRSVNRIRCDGEFWALTFDGRVCHVRDTRGLHWLAVLLRYPQREFPALTLEAVGRGAESVAACDSSDPAPRERARVRVTRALQNALTRISAVHPTLGRHLCSTIRTGGVCRYAPDPRLPVEWLA